MFPEEPKRATVCGVSYPTREVRENLTPHFAETGPGQGFTIGLLHANVGGNRDHDSYAPCTVSDLANTGFDYWALGHVHTRQTLRETGPAIVYPGNPQGRHPNEPGARGVYLVEVDDHGVAQLDFRPMDVVRWETLSLDIGPLETEQDLIHAVSDLAEDALAEAQGRSVVARLEFAGRGALHRWLRSESTAEDLREHAQRPLYWPGQLVLVRGDPAEYWFPGGPRGGCVSGGLRGGPGPAGRRVEGKR